MSSSVPADDHVHSEFSYDTGPSASMRESCDRAVALGIPSIAFTEHLDFTEALPGDAITPTEISRAYSGRRSGLSAKAARACRFTT